MASQPHLSIIITSYTTERLKDIAELLESIDRQTYPDIETIFVIEESAELLKGVKTCVEKNGTPNVRVVLIPRGTGASGARNIGVRNAKGEILGFVDDDVVLFNDWAEQIVHAYAKDDSVIGVTGPAYLLRIDKSMSWFPKELYWVMSGTDWCDWAETTEVRNVWTHNASFRREAFLGLHGPFLTTLGPREGVEAGWKWLSEDVELSLRVRRKTRKRIIYEPQAKVWHKGHRHRLSWGHIIRCSYWIGLTRYILRKFFTDCEKGITPLATENYLLRCILVKFIPRALIGLFKDPILHLKQLSATYIVLLATLLGFLSGFLITSTQTLETGMHATDA